MGVFFTENEKTLKEHYIWQYDIYEYDPAKKSE